MAQHFTFRHHRLGLFRLGMSLTLILLVSGPGIRDSAALAANIYDYTADYEGDPGDGVLDPRAREDNVRAAGIPSDYLITSCSGRHAATVSSPWPVLGIPTFPVPLGLRSDSGIRSWAGTPAPPPGYPGRGWPHAR